VPNKLEVTLLRDVAEAAERYKRAEQERQKAREDLRARIMVAADEGIPMSRIGRAAGLSRERVRQLRAGR
jgi:DNA-directed RNA polymerase sigma subunit (sigma70/sigma32)